MKWKDACQKGALLCLLGYSIFMFLSANGELELIALVGGLLGIIMRTYFPWVRKVAEGKILPNFDLNYAISGVLSFIATGHFFLMLGEEFMKMIGAVYTFVITFLFSLGINSGVNEGMKWFKGEVFREETMAVLKVVSLLTNPQVQQMLKKLGMSVSVTTIAKKISGKEEEAAEEEVQQKVEG